MITEENLVLNFTTDRKRKTHNPCPRCSLHLSRCICALIPTLNLRTKISLVIHQNEFKRTSNTGRLALRALPNSEMRIRGAGRETLDLSDLLVPSYRTLLFFPSENAQELTPEFVKESDLPIQLIVPDGNWRQASKVQYRHHELKDIPRVKINMPSEFRVHMRSETTENGMATLEAIAHALGIIEGPEVEEIMMNLYRAKLEATLRGRGKWKEVDP